MIKFKKIARIIFLSIMLCLFIGNYSNASKMEIFEKRTLQTKSFINDNGMITTEIHQIPIHYKKNGKWEDVNPNFETDDKFEYDFAMTKNAFHLYFSKVSNQPQKFAIGDDWITFQPLKGKNVHGVFDGNKALYTDVWENTDIEYVSNNLGLKENIILKSSDHPEQFSFKVHLRGFDYELSEDGSIVLKDKNGVTKAEIPSGYMEDANGVFSDQVEVNLKDQGNHLILTIIPNQQWLMSEERQYPIVIDPTITYLYTTVKQDAYVSQYFFSSKHGTSSNLEIGMNKPWFSNWVAQYSLLQFDVSVIPTDAVISSAQVELYICMMNIKMRRL